MNKSNVRVTSNIYPVRTDTREFFDGEVREIISKEGNNAYFQEISDLKALKTACDSCSSHLMPDPAEKPWGRVRIDGALVDICKCQRTSCQYFYTECRPELKKPNANQ